MHAHGTAVLPEPTAATLPALTCASSRERWLAKCESQLAKALATRNAEALPVIAPVVFVPVAFRCEDCRGTGYSDDDLEYCSCMGGERPYYDYPRHANSAVVADIIPSSEPHSRASEVWVPCPCGIGPAQTGPYLRGELIRVPWVPDCTTCNDTGWMFSYRTNQPACFLW